MSCSDTLKTESTVFRCKKTLQKTHTMILKNKNIALTQHYTAFTPTKSRECPGEGT